MESRIYESILKTICYADIFDYPLKEEEVYRWIKDIRILGYPDIKKANGVIIHKDKYMMLKGRESLLQERREREKESRKKLSIAKLSVEILRYIPTIKLIGVSGSVAAKNASVEDDIDIFIITKANTMWLTRFLATVIVELFAKRRRPGDKDVSNKICLNMFVDEKYLSVPKNRRNIYTAHEVCQLKVLFDRDSTYAKFLIANSWVKNYLPNAIVRIKDEVTAAAGSRNGGRLRINRENNINSLIINHLSFIIEFLAKHLQLWYMRKRLSTETITDGFLAFHPKDYTADVMAAFEERLKSYGSYV